MDVRPEATIWPRGSSEMARLIRTHEWAATPLGPITAWPQSLRTAVDICLGAAVPSYVWWGPDLIQISNDATLEINRAQHLAFLGTPAREAWADVWPEAGPLFAHVMTTGEPVRGDDVPMLPDHGGPPEPAWFSFSCGPARDESGMVAGVFGTAIETTARIQAEAAWRASEARYHALFASMAEGYARYQVITAPDGSPIDMQILEANPAYERLMQRPDPVGKRLREVAPEVDQAWIDTLTDVTHSGHPHRFERYNEALNRWFEVSVTPEPGHASEIVLVFS